MSRAARDIALNELEAHRRTKPSNLVKSCGTNQNPDCVAAWHERMKKWTNEHARLTRIYKAADKIDRAEYAAKRFFI